MHALQHAEGPSRRSALVMLPMLFRPGCSSQGEGGVPEITPASGMGAPVEFFRKHRLEAVTKVKPKHLKALALAHAPQHAPASAAGAGGTAIVPMELTPGVRAQEGPARPPEMTAGSGWRGATLSFRKHWGAPSVTKVHPMQPARETHAAQQASGSPAGDSARLCPPLFSPGKIVQGPGGGGGPVTCPLVTAGSGVAGSTELFR